MASLQETWTRFLAEYQALEVHLATEFRTAWSDVSALLQQVRAAVEGIGAPAECSQQLTVLVELFDREAQRLLREPMARYQHCRPLQRTLAALEKEHSALEDLLRLLPAAGLAPDELAGLGIQAQVRRWRLPWGDWSARAARSFRGAVSDALQAERIRRAPTVGSLELELARACLLLGMPWSRWMEWRLSQLAGCPAPSGEMERVRDRWTGLTAQLPSRVESLLERMAQAASEAAPRLSAMLAGSAWEVSESRRQRQAERLLVYFGYWARQQRAVAAVHDLQLRLADVGLELARESARSLESLERESRELLQELDGGIGWLEGRQEGIPASPLPGGEGSLVSASERVAEWVERAGSRVRSLLPITVEVLVPRRPLPGRRSPWRRLEPQTLLAEALAAAAPRDATAGFLEAEAAHRAIVREIERAREVVQLVIERAPAEGEAGLPMAREALGNALGLLRFCRSEATLAFTPSVERGLVLAQTQALLNTRAAFEKGILSLWARATKDRGRSLARTAWGASASEIRAGGRAAARAAEQGAHWLGLKAGWITPPEPAVEPLRSRPHLARILEVRLGERDLPMLYRRLFSLSPIKDPRFLVGRARELAGLGELLERWKAGQSVSGLIVGARGSGKSSLLNCAAASVFADEHLVRGAIGERLTGADAGPGFVGNLLGLPQGAAVGQALATERRVIVVEEFERSFLRAVGGFEAIKEFLRLIQATARTTLWIVVMNDLAFRYLDAVTQLGQRFSHRVNAMAVERQALVGSILQRHHLSALRLQFVPPPAPRPRIDTVRRSLGLQGDAEEAFFSALYRQSDGIFRSGFELWLDSIERVEGGVVHMRQPLDPDYRPLEAELTAADHHMLKAILQHGSLQAEHLAQVLGGSPGEQRLRLDRLQDLEIVEPDPSWPGHRIRPQAGRFVRHVLAAHNLLH